MCFHCGCGALHQLFLLAWIFEVSREFAELVYMCFVDLEKAFNRILWVSCGDTLYWAYPGSGPHCW